MDSAERLFHKFPRFVGPHQKLVRTSKDFVQHSFVNSGNEECFTSVYAFPFSFNSPLIDKVFLESDEGDSLRIGQNLFEWATENHYPTVPHWTGYRGPHIFPLCPNIYFKKREDAVDYIRRFTYYMLEETGLYRKEKVEGSNDIVKIPLIDTVIIGDVKRLTRIPETRRTSFTKMPLPTFCISLNPETFLDLNMKDVHELEKYPNPQPYDFSKMKPTKPFSDCDLASVDLTEWRGKEHDIIYTNSIDSKVPHTAVEILVKSILPRPCIYKHFIHPHCPTPIRYAGVSEMVEKGMKPNEIINIIEQLHWANYTPAETSKQVHAIARKGMSRAQTTGKRKLVQMGFCNPTDDICKRCV